MLKVLKRAKAGIGAGLLNVARSGAHLHADPRVQRRVIIGNTIALTLMVIALYYVQQFRSMGLSWPVIAPVVVAALVCPASIWLNGRGHFTGARIALIVAANGAVMLFRIAVGMRGDPPFLYAVGCLPLILADVNERRLLVFGVGLSVGSAILIKLGAERIMGPPLLTPALEFRMQAATIVITFLLLLSSVLHFVWANNRAERNLSVANEKLALSLAQLHEAQRTLVAISRLSGMAEVATSVLHNVGNVLNSVNVSAGVATDVLRSSKAAGLGKAVALIRGQGAGLGAYLTEDPKGRRVPDYLASVAAAINDEHQSVLGELASLQKNIDHIKVVVSAQQAHAAGGRGVTESLLLGDLANDALGTSFDSAGRPFANTTTVREFDDIGPVATERNKVMQILINLVKNAGEAMAEVSGPGRITVRVRRVNAATCAVEVEDTGCGIAPENLTRVFNHGFTTKKGGHGFGLHASANLAVELGGSLTADSQGPGRGARFILQIPFEGKDEVPRIAEVATAQAASG